MSILTKLSTAPLLILVFIACKREYSLEGGKKDVSTDSLPTDYPYATGYCNGSSITLGGAAVGLTDTVFYTSADTNKLPASFLLDVPAAGDQGSQGSCSAWATVYGVGSYYAHEMLGKSYSDTGNLSPKYTYNQIAKGNCGCSGILENLYLLKTQGACSLRAMPYNPLECALQPDSVQTNLAAPYKIKGWEKMNLHDLKLVKRAILDNKPVLFGIVIDDSFKALSAPYIWKERSGPVVGSHAMVVAGYDDSKHAFRIMNSWSKKWADQGFAWIDYDCFYLNVTDNGYVVY